MLDAARVDPPTQPLRFGADGRFELRPAEFRLLIDGQPAAVGGRALDLLIALAHRPNQLLSKDTLIDLVWPDVVVEENNLRVQVNRLRQLLGDDVITTVPGRGYRFSAPLLTAPALHGPNDHRQAPGATAAPTAAPAPTAVGPAPAATAPAPHPTTRRSGPERLFGRDADLAQLYSLLRDDDQGRCITLVGTAGVGKSSLARVALARWPTRAVWVDLAPLTDAAQLPDAVARALGARPDDAAAVQQLQRGLPANTALLLVLDNAEHLVDATAAVAAQLGGFSHLRLLVTSQLPLAIQGERVQRLAPLALDAAAGPPGVALDPAAALPLGDGALALLVDRIVAADRRFQATPARLPLLSALCTQLDGLPLALEMAAARVPLMGLRAVHEHLAERFAMLTRGRRDAPVRHRTLHDALDWSYRLLGAAEQQLFRALGLFSGGFTLELALALAAETAADRWDVVDRLATLTDRSLVTVSADDPPRYRLLETMRAFALEQLATSATDDLPALRARHAAAVMALFERHESDALCLAEMENARDAFAWARQHDLALAARLSAQAIRITIFTAWRLEATGWMRSLEPLMAPHLTRTLPPALRADWWTMLARALVMQQDPAALVPARQAVALWRGLAQPQEHQFAVVQWVRAIPQPGAELDEACAELVRVTAQLTLSPRDQLRMQGALASAAIVRGDWAAELACREAELQLSTAMAWPEMVQSAEGNLCLSLTRVGRAAEAAVRGRQLLLRLDADGGDANGNLPWALNALIKALTMTGELAEAQALAPRALAACQRFDTHTAWPSLMLLAVAQRRYRAGALLLGYILQAGGSQLDHEIQAQCAGVRVACVDALGETPTDALVMRGRRLDVETAQALAAGDDGA